ncbi:hypothetical protein FZ983_12005 [Azospirillum sp. B21]|uniref:hypothetical protein n=1 Tax=Azospirillum sp. B21 TaxID=2607496 RepID=UPI0011EB9FCD|nr:hypothetical protein [Azospirillum sp. B21]KAA0580306.1 hypothetical protein FZ983_12005 [Azospirillum sp. B21]
MSLSYLAHLPEHEAPKPIPYPGRVVRYDTVDLDAWVSAGKLKSVTIAIAHPPATRHRRPGRPTKAQQIARRSEMARLAAEA